MSFDAVSYIMGYGKGEAESAGTIVIEGSVTCTDPSDDGNIVITEEN